MQVSERSLLFNIPTRSDVTWFYSQTVGRPIADNGTLAVMSRSMWLGWRQVVFVAEGTVLEGCVGKN